MNLYLSKIRNFIMARYWKLKNWIIPVFFRNKDLPTTFKLINTTNYWWSEESKSWPWSEEISTRYIRQEILKIIKNYWIKSILDLPCGDCNWIKPTELQAGYLGADIVDKIVQNNIQKFEHKVNFQVLDITTDKLPYADLILCRECLQHLSYSNIHKTLENIKKSKIKYLLTTSHPQWKNTNIIDGLYFDINLEASPFNLKNPIQKIEERESNKIQNRRHKQYLFLYEIKDILQNP